MPYDTMLLLPLVHYSIGICSFSFMLMTVSRPRLHFFPVPSFGPPHSLLMVCSSVHTLTIDTRSKRSTVVHYSPLSALVSRSLSSSLLFRHYILSGSPFLFHPRRVVLSLSQLHGTVPTPSRWHPRLLSTIYLIGDSVTPHQQF